MSKARLLIVEDEQIIALDIRNSLETLGYTIVGHADRGETAVNKAGELQPNLILMDIGLKGEMDGIQAAEQIRTRFNLPVIFLTSYSDQSTLERARVTEPFGYLIKPFEERELVSTIEMALYKHTMEKKLRESEERYRRLAENALDIVFRYEINPVMRLTYINPTVQAITGFTPDECYADSNLMLNMIHPDDLELMTNYIQALALPNGPLLARWIDKEGKFHWMESRMVPVFDSTGGLVAVEGITRDITDQKNIETEREKLIAELKLKNNELERFTYIVSHDLKAPLFTIQGFVGYLEKDIVSGYSERTRNDVNRINNAIEKMHRLLNELLELSRVGRVINPAEEVSINIVVQDAISLVAGRIADKQVALEIESDLPVVSCDRMRLTQVFQNLIDNAVKFIHEQPSPQIRIGQRKENLETIIFVQDNGMGIALEDQDRVFGLFDKLDSNAEGTGIGLALVKRIIETHGGKIWVESEGLGKGSIFCFTIP